MKRLLFLVVCLVLLGVPLVAQDIALLYRCADTNEKSAQIKPFLNLVNNTSQRIDLGDFKIRYWYTIEGNDTQQVSIDYSVYSSAAIKAVCGDGYVELFFEPGNHLASASQTGEIQLRIYNNGWGEYTQSNDFSFDPSMLSFGENQNITLYKKGEIIGGTEPVSTPTPSPSSTPLPPVTPAPTGYEVRIESIGHDTMIKYTGDKTGEAKTPFSLYDTEPFSVTMNLTEIDVPNGHTGGKFLWVIDNIPPWGEDDSSRWIYPTDTAGFSASSKEGIDTLTIEYKDYNDEIEMPTHLPSLTHTPPPPAFVNLAVKDSESGSLVSAPDLSIKLVNIRTLSVQREWEAEPMVMTQFRYADRHCYLEISASGYYDIQQIMPYNFRPDSEPFEILMSPDSLNTPLAKPTSLPRVKPDPYYWPENPGTWYLTLKDEPPVVSFFRDGNIKVSVKVPFDNTAARALDWGKPVLVGNTFVVDLQLVNWDGPAAPWTTWLEHSYDLDIQNNEDYFFEITMWGEHVETFPVPSAVADVNFMEDDLCSLSVDPSIKLDVVQDNERLDVQLTAMLFGVNNSQYKVLSWGVPQIDGNHILFNPKIYEQEGDLGTGYTALYYSSYAYDLKDIPKGAYEFEVRLNESKILDKNYIIREPLPNATAPPDLDFSPASGDPILKIISVPAEVSYPQKSYELQIKNYGAKASIETSKYLTDFVTSITPSSMVLDRDEAGVFNITVDWNPIMDIQSIISYNALFVTAPAYYEYLKFNPVLNTKNVQFYSISGHVEPVSGIISVQLDGEISRVVSVDSQGNYRFENVPEGGDYRVRVLRKGNPPQVMIHLAQNQVNLKDVLNVSVDITTDICGVDFQPAKIEFSELSESKTNQDFQVGALTACRDMIAKLEFKIDGLLKFVDTNVGMGVQNYEQSLDISDLSPGTHILEVVAVTDDGKIGKLSAAFEIEEGPVQTCPVEKGDVNDDGVINIVDALLIAQYYVGIPVPGFIECAADIDNPCFILPCLYDINIVDAMLVAQYYVGIINKL